MELVISRISDWDDKDNVNFALKDMMSFLYIKGMEYQIPNFGIDVYFEAGILVGEITWASEAEGNGNLCITLSISRDFYEKEPDAVIMQLEADFAQEWRKLNEQIQQGTGGQDGG